jgi:hypothetical protein
MKRLNFIWVFLLIIGLLPVWTMPAMAADGSYTKIQTAFTLDPGQPGMAVEKGSIIHHLANGVTEVYGADKSLKLKALESEASMVQTPDGALPANRIYHVPNGCLVDTQGVTTRILDKDNTCILTIIDDKQLQPNTVIPIPTPPWLADTACLCNNIDYFDAYWVVPSKPPHYTSSYTNQDFYFTGIGPQNRSFIMQPVLQWNQCQNHKWQIQSYYVWGSGMVAGAAYDANQADTIYGRMSWGSGIWYIITKDGSKTSSLGVVGSVAQKLIYCTLEGSNIINSQDIPGSTSFNTMHEKYGGNSIPITWLPDDNPPLQITIPDHSPSLVTIHTPN